MTAGTSAKTSAPASPFSGPAARQFIKFCVVGGSSFLFDIVTYNLLLHLGLPPLAASTVAFAIGVSNGYIWNSRWTFKDRRGDPKKQIPLFFATNFVGYTLNIGVTTVVLIAGAHYGWIRTHHTAAETIHMLLFRSINQAGGFSFLALNAAKVCATIVVTIWNFGASKFITFRG